MCSLVINYTKMWSFMETLLKYNFQSHEQNTNIEWLTSCSLRNKGLLNCAVGNASNSRLRGMQFKSSPLHSWECPPSAPWQGFQRQSLPPIVLCPAMFNMGLGIYNYFNWLFYTLVTSLGNLKVGDRDPIYEMRRWNNYYYLYVTGYI